MAKRKLSDTNWGAGLTSSGGVRGKKYQSKKKSAVRKAWDKARSVPEIGGKRKPALKVKNDQSKRVIKKIARDLVGKRGVPSSDTIKSDYAKSQEKLNKELKKKEQSRLIKKYQDLGKL